MDLPGGLKIPDYLVVNPASGEARCLVQANNTPQVKRIDQLTEDLARNWRPTGFYTIPEMQAVTQALLSATLSAELFLNSELLNATGDAQSMRRQALVYLQMNKDRVALYAKAAAEAKAAGQTILHAPGLKDAVLKSLVNVSQAYVTVYAINCRANVLDRAAATASEVWRVAKQVVGVAADLAIAAGKAVKKVVEGVWDWAGVLKWVVVLGGIGVAGLWGYDRWNRYTSTQRALRAENR